MIPYSKQFIDKGDIKSVVKTLKSAFLTQGPQILKFEKEISKKTKAKYTAVVNSATSALHISCMALGFKKKDILWTVPNTFVASSNCALHLGGKVDFVDIDYESGNISVEKLEQKLIQAKKYNKLPKILIPVHFAGNPTAQDEIYNLSRKYKFKIIEDASHSIGAKHLKEPVGSCKWSDITVFSFHPVKIVTTGEGGNIATNNKSIFDKVSLLRTHGVRKNLKLSRKYGNWYYQMENLGYNYRLADINAALGTSQISKIKKFIKKRKFIANIYNNSFNKNNNFIIPFNDKYSDHSFHIYPLQIKFENLKIDKKTFFKKLKKKKINLQVHYIPIHLQRFYRKKFGYKPGDFPVSEKFYKREVSLPIYYQLKKKQIKFIMTFCLESTIIKPEKDNNINNAVVLLHGYGGDGKDISMLSLNWKRHMPNTVFICPNGHEVCQINPSGFQWFDLTKDDPDYILEQSIKAENKIQNFINEIKQEFNLTNNKICLAGFSQGCMLSLNVGLITEEKFSCIVGFSGKIIDQNNLKGRVKNFSDVLLIHGDADQVVPSTYLLEAKDFLIRNGINVQTLLIKNCDHHIPMEASSTALNYILKKI